MLSFPSLGRPPGPRKPSRDLEGRLLALLLLFPAALPARDWPEFRGPTGQGIAAGSDLPIEWSAEKNVIWKVPVPGHGWSSPVAGGGRIYLTSGIGEGASAPSLQTLCFDSATGKLLWSTEVFSPSETSAGPLHKKNSPASPTPILTDQRLFVHFGPHGTACLDLAGRILWRNRDLGYNPVHGAGGSPALVGNRLIFTADGARDPAVVALEADSGRLAWKTARTVVPKQPFSFSTPLLITVSGRSQLVAPGSGAVVAYDPEDGRELWHVRYGTGYSVIPRPIHAHGLVFIASGFMKPDLLAVRPDGAGDVTDSHVAWRTARNAPLTPSLVAVGDEVYAVSDPGIATCFDARTGKVHWEERVEPNHSASPLAAGGRLYFQSEAGITTVVRAGPKFERLAVNRLGERTFASIAVTGTHFLIRSEHHLFRIGASAGE
jgi:outer membrane protein assembly factor BamB